MKIVVSALARFHSPTGICRYTSGLVSTLVGAQSVSAVTLIIGEWQRDYYERCFALNHPKLRIRTVKVGHGSISRNLWYLYGLPDIARMEKADLVHLTFPLPFDRSRFPCPVVATIHDLYPYDYPDNFGFPAYFLNRVFLKVCVSQADALCCVSGYTRDRTNQLFSDMVSDKPLLTTGNIVELSSDTPAPPKWMDSANPGEYLLSVAQHRKNKRLDLLINAFAVLKEREDLPATTRLIIVGSHGPETPKIMSLIQSLRLSNSVFLISGVTDNELAWLYQNAQALIITSSIEGFCIPLIEALKYHTRVVCSDIPILREIGRNSCQYFNSVGDSTEALVSAIIFSLSSPRASSIDLERFSVGNLQPIYLELYSTLVL